MSQAKSAGCFKKLLPITIGFISLFSPTVGTAQISALVAEPIQQVALTTVAQAEVVPEVVKPDFSSTTVVKEYVETEAIKKGVDPKLALSIVQCESGFVPQKSKYPGEESYGIWQIHLPAHKEFTIESAMDIATSTEWALNQLKAGNAKIWSCWGGHSP